MGGGEEMRQYPLTLLQGSNSPHTASQHSNEDERLSPLSPLTVNRPMGLFGVTLHPYSHYSLIETHPQGHKHTHKHREIYRKLHHLPKHRIPLPETAVNSKKRGSINNGLVQNHIRTVWIFCCEVNDSQRSLAGDLAGIE